jgi:Fe-S oxidoreductase/nitrate reductase gamma subunit
MLAFLYTGSFLALAVSAWRLYRRVHVWQKGTPADLQISFRQALKNVAGWMVNRSRMPRDRFASTMHSLILWGFIVLFMGTVLVFLEHQTPLHFYYGPFYLIASAILDLGGIAFLLGLSMAVYRRHVGRTSRLKPSGWVDGMLHLLMAVAVTGFLVEGFRISVTLPAFEKFSFAGYGLALVARSLFSPASLPLLHRTSWVLHAALCIVFFGLATVYFFRHAILSILAVALRPARASGRLRSYSYDSPSYESPPLAPGSVATISWKDLLDSDACTTCGRCSSVCPAKAAGKDLDPREVVVKLSKLVDRSTAKLNGECPTAFDTITDRELWDCTTCGACVYECPVNIEVYDKIIDLRRQLVDAGRVSSGVRSSLEGLKNRQNPWDYSPSQRAAWMEGLKLPSPWQNSSPQPEKNPEWIYWVGCAGAFEPSAQSITKSMIALLGKARVSFTTLGCQERCSGDPARRLGDEALFQSFKNQNLQLLRSTGINKIVTHCPHCLNTFKNEYQNRENQFRVVHHTQFLKTLVDEGKLRLTNSENQDVTFHDPCYLGRHNGEFDAPRDLVKAVAGNRLLEMNRNRDKSFCCGGGGGQMWLESSGQERVEGIRFSEAVDTGARVLATACPFCKIMMESASATAGKQNLIAIKDIAEILNEAAQP